MKPFKILCVVAVIMLFCGTAFAQWDSMRSMQRKADVPDSSAAAFDRDVLMQRRASLSDSINIRIFPNTIASDSSGVGDFKRYIAGEDVVKGQLLRIHSDGKLYKADADSVITIPGMYIAASNAAASGTVLALHRGRFRLDSWNWTPGVVLYASTDTGLITSTIPSGSGDQIQIIGIAETADEILVIPSAVTAEVP